MRLDWRALNRKPAGWRGWVLFVALTFAGAATMGLILGQERTRILWVSTGSAIGVVVSQVFRAASGRTASAGPSSPPPQRPS